MNEWNQFPTQPEEPDQNLPPKETETQETPKPEAPSSSYNPYGWNTPTYPAPQPVRKRRNGAKIALVVLGSFCAVIIAALSVLLALSYQNINPFLPPDDTQNSPVDKNVPSVTITELDESTQGLSTAEIVQKNIDSTVLLTIYSNTSGISGFPFSQNYEEKEVQSGVASGIVMSADGYIITNWHCVVDEETNTVYPRIDVTTYDETVYEDAQVIGYDASTDLAVIKVDATDLQPATFGNSDQLRMGDRVVALGNSGGMGWSTTQGIVSGLARDVYEDTGYSIKCLQVDAAINPGNSGGPLFNAAGQVIAVNSAKIVASGYEGIGFSIPINEAKVIIDDLFKNGYVTGRVSLGITGQTYSDTYYKGFLIYSIEKDSSLQNTEAKRGDLITAIDSVEITSYAELRAELAKHKVGDTVTLTLLRATGRRVEEFTVTAKLAEAKGN